MLDYIWHREFLYGVILGIVIVFGILIPLIEGPPPLLEIELPPLVPLDFLL